MNELSKLLSISLHVCHDSQYPEADGWATYVVKGQKIKVELSAGVIREILRASQQDAESAIRGLTE